MFKRFIALFLAVGMCLSLSISVMASDGMREIEVRLTAFEDYTAEGSSLTADRVTSSDGAALFEETNDGMKLTGAIPGEKEYNISVVISNSEFIDAAEKNGNYTVLSVIAFEDIVRVILGDNDKNNMYYIEFGSDTLTSVKPYKVNWYHSFLAPEVEAVDNFHPNSLTDHDKEFSTSTTIYGDKYEEILVLRFSNDWDNPVSAGVGYSAITKMRLLSKTTSITRSGSSKATTAQGNSLFVNRIKYTSTSPYGEYFRKIDTQFTGTVYKTASVGIGVGIAIANTPFSIDLLSLPTKETKTIGSSSIYFDLDKYSSSSKVPMAIKVEYMDTNIRLDTAGSHSVVVENSLKTHDNYIRYEQKKLSYRWDYYVASTGNCNGVDVTMISEPQYFLNHLYYTLTK